MPYHIQSTKPAAHQLWNPRTGMRCDLFPGITKISDEQYEAFKDKIAADPQLSMTKPINEAPVKASKSTRTVVEDEPLEPPTEAGETAVDDSSAAEEPSKKGKKGK